VDRTESTGQLRGHARVSGQSAPESMDRLYRTPFVNCTRGSERHGSELSDGWCIAPGPVGSLGLSQWVIGVPAQQYASESACSWCLSQAAVGVRVSRQSGSKSDGNPCPSPRVMGLDNRCRLGYDLLGIGDFAPELELAGNGGHGPGLILGDLELGRIRDFLPDCSRQSMQPDVDGLHPEMSKELCFLNWNRFR
jgi:hypothetical protein